jgi:hypothetical protein
MGQKCINLDGWKLICTNLRKLPERHIPVCINARSLLTVIANALDYACFCVCRGSQAQAMFNMAVMRVAAWGATGDRPEPMVLYR